MLANSTFGAKLEEWLRTLRKKNAAVVLTTKSLSEIANSPQRNVILESCPTKLCLRDAEALNPQTRELCRKFGLSDRKSTSSLRPRAGGSPVRGRACGPPLIGAASKEDVLAARRMITEQDKRWRVEWLRTCGPGEWAD